MSWVPMARVHPVIVAPRRPEATTSGSDAGPPPAALHEAKIRLIPAFVPVATASPVMSIIGLRCRRIEHPRPVGEVVAEEEIEVAVAVEVGEV